MEEAQHLRLDISTSFLPLIRLDAHGSPTFFCRVHSMLSRRNPAWIVSCGSFLV